MKINFTQEAQEYIAKYFGDLSKAIITVGFASYFFKELPVLLRFGFCVLAIALFFASVILIQKKGK